MGGVRGKWRVVRAVMCIWWSFDLASLVLVIAEEGSLKKEALGSINATNDYSTFVKSLREPKASGHNHVWPELKFGWKIVVGSIIGFLGAAFGSVGGVGGGGIFVPMLTLILRFDPKSATAISKCMITGAAVSTVYCNLRLRHPTMEMPVIDYDLAVLMQPMLLLGINIGVAFNVILADWMVTVLLILLFTGLSTLAFLRGVASWKKETKLKKEAAQIMLANGGGTFPCCPITSPQKKAKVCILENVYWKQFGLICFVWVASLALQITKQNYTTTCSTLYWVVNLLQIPICFGVSWFEAFGLYKGWRKISSNNNDSISNLRPWQLIILCIFGIVAGTVGALLGLGGGFIMGPLFLELGVPPEVSTATSTFIMVFSSSIAIVEYYLLKRFPVTYAVCLTVVATFAAFVGQHAVRKVNAVLGRASLIIFTLAFIILISTISLGGIGISNMIKKIHHHENMGFESLCKYNA
ncbi:sulfite exporter TauE/SafE family protein 3-like [Ipomoea triloba]|uniref:sulfite exporter TauE/SafE family protein 3-like n=1 Tax=Ipomoea triloba TaxID=35885 RepID=UPI00125D5453|nr:sulfite exporter TauE/SafE family protein 3-like [Ipomoea triloba]